MATPTSYSTSNKEGVDVTVIYTVTASTTPETPAPPFSLGDIVQGPFGAEWVFVQASTSISPNDFVAIKGSYQANSLSNTTVAATGGVSIGVAPGATTAGGGTSPSMLAGTYFWAQIRGSQVAGNAVAASTTSNVSLFTTAVAGVVASVTGSSGISLGGIVMTLSATANPQTFMLTWPRAVVTTGLGTVNP